MKNANILLVIFLITPFFAAEAGQLSRSEFKNISFTNFNVVHSRDYVSGELLNTSSYTINSCTFRFSVYEIEMNSELMKVYNAVSEKYSTVDFSTFYERVSSDSSHHQVYSKTKECYPLKSEVQFTEMVNDFLRHDTKLILSRKLKIRKTVEPGYSTDFQFEIKMAYYGNNILFVKEILEVQGKK